MKKGKPRSGSMQFWPRKRAKKETPRIRSWANDKGLLGFAGYKAGMTQIIATDAHKTSLTKGEDIVIPVTVIECPPLKIFSVRFYSKDNGSLIIKKEIALGKDNFLSRVFKIKKLKELKELESLKEKENEFEEFRLLLYTQPSLTSIGKKKPDIVEIKFNGNFEELFNFVKEHLQSGIKISELFKEGDYVDIHAVTKGKGYQGPVKRFGIGLTSHKSEKKRRAAGAIGSWVAQQHWHYRIPLPGQMGYHLRTQYNNQILVISDDPKIVNVKGGFLRYGFVKNEFILIRGSIPGPKKRLISIVKTIRNPKKKLTKPTLQKVILESPQKR